MDTGLPAGSPTSGAFHKLAKQLLCRTLKRYHDVEIRDDSGVSILVALKIVPEFVAVSARFSHPTSMLNEAHRRGTLRGYRWSPLECLKAIAAAQVEKADNVS